MIGIDLGTTNCTVSYVENGEIFQLSIPQMVTKDTEGEQFSLPSFLYFPLPEENLGSLSAGLFARERGREVPTRLIASAKSWLCHSGIDRREKLLPFGTEEELEKLSPLEACAKLLEHIKHAWETKMPSSPFERQQILITVPASFDPSARQLVEEAATLAAYPEIILLEEPQAAFYAWLHRNEESWRKQLHVGDTILVVDIGGGTTDFSLISVADEGGNLILKRIAVGAHLLLGGDNIDLSLAYRAKDKLEKEGHFLDEWQMQGLIYSCRQAKEQLLGTNPPHQVDIAIMGRGSRLIGGSLTTFLTKEEVEAFVLDGFVPKISPAERSKTERRSGMQQVGLPYAQDARISCQLAKFLSMTGESESCSMETFVLPSAVLFNGGTLKSEALRKRLLEVLNSWAKELKAPPVKELPDPDFDFAVSWGAAYYGLSRTGKGVRIRSGTSRNYFIGVQDAVPAIPGLPTPIKAICVVPYGMEEGTEKQLENQEFALVVGEHATFRFFSQSSPHPFPIGSVVKNWKQDLTELHPLETYLEQSGEDGKTVRVKLKSKVTELGVLELWCESQDGRKWKLEFDIREPAKAVL